MPKFIFQLEGVLRHRAHLEDARKREWAEARSAYKAVEDKLRALNESLQATTADIRQNHLVGVLDLPLLAAHRRYTAAMQRQGHQLVQQLAQHQVKVNAAQAALATAARDRKIIEKLREKQFARWKADQDQREVARLDEVNMQMAFGAALEDGQTNVAESQP